MCTFELLIVSPLGRGVDLFGVLVGFSGGNGPILGRHVLDRSLLMEAVLAPRVVLISFQAPVH
jgi:hypothetical protein